jgi:hypothetical protein
MAVDDSGEDVREVSHRIDAVELAGLDQRSDDGPILSSAVRAGEKRVFPIERNLPFILPVLEVKSRFIIPGTRCMAGGSLCITERRGPALC